MIKQTALTLLMIVCGLVTLPHAYAEGGFVEAITGGKLTGQLRPRFEWVDQEGKPEQANAFTLRTQLGYATGEFRGFSAFLQFEDVHNIGGNQYNDTINGLTRFPVVADPESTEVNQAYLSYKGQPDTLLSDTVFKYGRQIINLDNQRFIGDVGWRQNSQTFDALAITSTLTNNLNLFFSHVSNVNRVFGEKHPTLSDIDLRGELLNVAYRGIQYGTLVGYAYLLDYEPGQPIPPSASNKTLGVRFDGWYQQEGGVKYFYTAEYADQSDYQDGANTVNGDYKNLILGLEIQGFQVKLNYEVLSGNGVYGFATPLATLHAFNGWADQFLTTPKDGLRDVFVTASKSWAGINWLLRYDSFSSDHDGYDYGSEWNFSAAKKLNKNITVVLKYAAYSGDANTINLTRNPALAGDLDKFWLQADFQF